MAKRIDNLAYDVILNQANFLTIVKYRVIDREEIDENGRKNYFRQFLYIDSEACDDIELCIAQLRKQGYLYINRFFDSAFDITSTSPIVSTKLMFLERNHKLLEKVYQEEVLHNMTYLATYITCIHMKTGKISFIKVANFLPEQVDDLKSLGYKTMEDSFYYAYTNSMGEQKRR